MTPSAFESEPFRLSAEERAQLPVDVDADRLERFLNRLAPGERDWPLQLAMRGPRKPQPASGAPNDGRPAPERVLFTTVGARNLRFEDPEWDAEWRAIFRR